MATTGKELEAVQVQGLKAALQEYKSQFDSLVTLNSAPTSSTLTYTHNGKTYAFKVGDEVRVADAENASEGANGYVYYKLYDIQNSTAYWDLGGSGGSGGGALGKVRVYLKDVINDVENLSPSFAGVVVTLTNTTDNTAPVTKTLAAGESSVVFRNVTPLKNYSVSVSQLDAQHTTPQAQTITNLAIGEEKELTFAYEADEYTVNIASNQGSDSAISSAKVTYNNVQYGDGDKFKVAKGTTVSPTASDMSDVTDYTKSISLSGKTINALYSTTLVAVSVVSNQSDFAERKAYTINRQQKYVTATGTTPALTGTVKVPTGTALTITAPDIEHYAKSVSSYGNATGVSQTIEVTYQATKVNLQMVGVESGVEGNFPTGAQGTVKHTGGADQTLTDNTATALVPTGSAFTVEYAAVSGYGTPTTYSGTAAGTTMTVSKASYTYGMLTVNLTTSDNDDTDLAKAKVYITVGSGQEEELTGTITSHTKTFQKSVVPGSTYSLRFGAVAGYDAPATISNATMPQAGTDTVTRQYATTILSASVSADTGTPDLTGVTMTVTDTTSSATVTVSNGQYKIPTGHAYLVAVSGSVDGYNAPADVTGTATGSSASVTMIYTKITVITGYVILDQTTSDPTKKVIDESGNTYSNYQRPTVITAIRNASHCYVGTFASNKMTLKQLDDSDGTKYADGTSAATDITGSTGKNVFMRLPFFFTRVSTVATDKVKIEFAYDPSQTATTTAQPSGSGWMQWGGNDLIGKYEACSTTSASNATAETANGTSGYLRSRSTGADSLASVSQANFKQKARNNGTGFSIVKWRHQNLMAILFYAYYGHTNCQSLIGSGANSYSGSTRYIGLKNSLGMTDTTASNGNTDNTVFWGLENWWGCKYEWVDNVVVNSGTWTITEDDGTTRTLTAGTNVMTAAGSWVYPSKFALGDNLDVVGAVGQTKGSDSQGYCDGQYIANSESRVVLRSFYDAYAVGGVAYVLARNDSSYTDANLGSRLAFTGTIEIS